MENRMHADWKKWGKTPQGLSQLPDLRVNKSSMKYWTAGRDWSQAAA
jgi:hypothetical protein